MAIDLRRAKQIAYNYAHNVLPSRAKKSGSGSALLTDRAASEESIQPTTYATQEVANTPAVGVAEQSAHYATTASENTLNASLEMLIDEARRAMEEAAKALDFVAAAKHRDRMRELQTLAKNRNK